MTGDEEAYIIGDAFKRFRSASRRLVCLKTKAENMVSILRSVIESLDFKNTAHVSGDVVSFHTHSNIVQESIRYPSITEIKDVLEDIEKTKEETRSLTNKLKELGFSNI